MAEGGQRVEFQRQIVSGPEGAEIRGNFGGLEEKGRVYQDPEGFLVIDRSIGSYHLTEKVRYEFPGSPS